jgi:hypothetical protein
MIRRRRRVVFCVRPIHVLAAAIPVAGVLAFAAGAAGQTPAGIEITSDDRGRTFNAVIGQQVTVRLGTGLAWTVSEEPAGILAPAPGVGAPPAGVQAVLRAAQPGTVTITGTGKPICKPGEFCPQFVTLFTATVVVAPAGGGGQPSASPARTQQPVTPGTVTPPSARPSPPTGVHLPNTGSGAGAAADHASPLLGVALLLALAGLALERRRSA